MKKKKIRKNMTAVILASIAVLLFFTACASVSPAGDDDALNIIGLINSGRTDELVSLSADSFLLDTEILHGTALTASFWKGLAAAGFTLDNAVIIESRPPTSADTGMFGKSIETETFFTKYLVPDSILFRIGADQGETALILSPDDNGDIEISAFGGPY